VTEGEAKREAERRNYTVARDKRTPTGSFWSWEEDPNAPGSWVVKLHTDPPRKPSRRERILDAVAAILSGAP
jgi:hypothetical protein